MKNVTFNRENKETLFIIMLLKPLALPHIKPKTVHVYVRVFCKYWHKCFYFLYCPSSKDIDYHAAAYIDVLFSNKAKVCILSERVESHFVNVL